MPKLRVQVLDDRGLADEGTAAVAADDELPIFQSAQSFAQGGTGHIQLLGQVSLGRQGAAWRVHPPLNRLGQRLYAHIREAHAVPPTR